MLALAAAAAACKTPVYRFAMYDWAPSPYRVYYFYEGKFPATDQLSHLALTEAAHAEHVPANLELHAIDLTAQEPLSALPPQLQVEAEEYVSRARGQGLPAYVILTPDGSALHLGGLTTADVDALIDSPARRQLVALLASGHAGVLVVLPGSDSAANEQAQAAVERIVRRAAEGELPPPDLPPSDLPPDLPRSADPGDPGDPADPAYVDAGAEPREVRIGVVRIEREDLAESWLVRMLLETEHNLHDIDQPMVFMVYGRGRAMPPCIGRGVNDEQLARQVQFILGPCSCTAKRDNPGMDLLTRYDWDSAALAMAQAFGPETGNEKLLGESPFPEVFPAAASRGAADEPEDGAPQTPPAADAPSPAVGAARADDTTPAWKERPSQLPADAEPAPAPQQEIAVVRNLGLGVAVALAVLAAASFVLLGLRR